MNPSGILSMARAWLPVLIVIAWLVDPTAAGGFVADLGWALRDLFDPFIRTVF